MKILHTVESYLPLRHGMSEVVKWISEGLAKKGHEVVIATSSNDNRLSKTINGVHIQEFNIEGNLVRGMSGEVEKYKSFLLNSEYDIITNFAAQQWATDICLDLLPMIKAKKVFVPTGFSGLNDPIYSGYFERMRTWMKYYDANVFLSDEYKDISFARSIGTKCNIMIPNGASSKEFLEENLPDIREKFNIPADHFLILHVGSYTGLKGHDEALEIVNHVDYEKLVLLFVGQNFNCDTASKFVEKISWFKGFSFRKKLNKESIKAFINLLLRRNARGQRVILTALTREETVAAFKQADLFLFPSQIECSPIVLFEAMASHTPFLATEVGNVKEIIQWSGGGILLPTKVSQAGYGDADIVQSAKIMSKLIDDKIKQKELAYLGFKSWKDNFTWEKIVLRYNELYCSLVK